MTIMTTLKTGLAAALLAAGLAAPALARDIQTVTITLDLETQTSDARVEVGGGQPDFVLTSATQIVDGSFARMDLRVILPQNTEAEPNKADDAVQRRVDQGFTDEPAGCDVGGYGPLDMEDGLRYFFAVDLQTGAEASENVRATIYPGNRSTHWTNDVFCEHATGASGEDLAVIRFTGFFYVIHRALQNGTDIQLRPITLTEGEVERFTSQ